MPLLELIAEDQKEAADGVAGLDASRHLDAARLPDTYLPAALGSTLYPQKASWVDPLFVGRFEIADGTPTKTATSRLQMWRLADTGSNESVSGMTYIPSYVELVTIKVLWRPSTGTDGSKTTRLSFFATEVIPDETLPGDTKLYEATSDVPAASGQHVVTTVATEVAVTPGASYNLRLTRNTASAGDTYTGGIDLVAVIISHPYIGPGSPIVSSSFSLLADDGTEPNHNGFPHACRIPDDSPVAPGRIVAIWRRSTEHATTEAAATILRYSDDDGTTWSSEIVAQTGTSTHHYRGACISALSDGRLILSSIAVQYDPTVTTIPDALRIQVSEDGGLTWSAPATIDLPYTEPMAVQGEVCELDDGTLLLAPYLGGLGYKCVVIRSHIDNPLDWEPLAELTVFDGTIATESQIINMGGDNVLARVRIEELDGSKFIWDYNSADKGATWVNARRGHEGQGAPRTIRVASGALVAVVRGKLIAGLLNQHPKIYTSIDDAGTWLGPWGLDEDTSIVEDVYCSPVPTSVPNEILVVYGMETVDHQDSEVRVRAVEIRS